MLLYVALEVVEEAITVRSLSVVVEAAALLLVGAATSMVVALPLIVVSTNAAVGSEEVAGLVASFC